MCEEARKASHAIGHLQGEVKGLIDSHNKSYDRMNRIDKEVASLEAKLDRAIHGVERSTNDLKIKVYSIIAVASAVVTIVSLLARFIK